MLIKRIAKHIVDAEWVTRVIEVLDRRSDNRMTELGMLIQTFGFAKISEVPGNYLELGLWARQDFRLGALDEAALRSARYETVGL